MLFSSVVKVRYLVLMFTLVMCGCTASNSPRPHSGEVVVSEKIAIPPSSGLKSKSIQRARTIAQVPPGAFETVAVADFEGGNLQKEAPAGIFHIFHKHYSGAIVENEDISIVMNPLDYAKACLNRDRSGAAARFAGWSA